MLLNAGRADHIMRERGLDALIATSRENIIYLSGASFRSGLGLGGRVFACLANGALEPAFAVVPAALLPTLLEQHPAINDIRACGGVPFYIPAQTEGHRMSVPVHDTYPDPMAALTAALQDHGLSRARIGVDEQGLTHQQWVVLESAISAAQPQPASRVFLDIRAVKTEEEVKRLTRAAQIAEKGMAKSIERIKPGITTWDLLRAYLAEVGRQGGCNGSATIVAGPNGAVFLGPPDTVLFEPSQTPIAVGHSIKYDVSCSWAEYRADTARTVVMGEPSPALGQRFRAVHDAHLAAMDSCGPDVTASALYELTMAAMRKAGLEGFQRGHCGHGIGLLGHELPHIVPSHNGRDVVLEQGMVICLENTLFEIGLGTLSVEDTVVVTETGCRTLTEYPRHFQKLPG
jgi:Xaa-Pro dipeptidase